MKKILHYGGQRVASYTHDAGTGLIGKVLGPNVNGRWFVITEAHYDSDTDTTYATAEELLRPELKAGL